MSLTPALMVDTEVMVVTTATKEEETHKGHWVAATLAWWWNLTTAPPLTTHSATVATGLKRMRILGTVVRIETKHSEDSRESEVTMVLVLILAWKTLQHIHCHHNLGMTMAQKRNSSSSSSSSSSSKKCAAALLLDTVTWRVEASVGQQPKALLLDAARTGQLHVSGFDTQGRPVVVYSPTSEADCPVWLAVLWLVYNLERAIALGEAGAGPQGKVSPQYTFVITFARTGVPPMKTVRACLEVFGKHYPGRSGPILLCHGGTVSAWVARWLKPLAPPHQRDKLKLVSAKEDRSGFMATLVEPGQLEPRFGGGTSTFSFDPEVYLADYKPVDPADYLATNLAYLNQDDGRSIVGIKI